MRTIELMLRHGKMTLANAFQRKGAIRKEEYVLSVADIVTSLHAHKQILAEGRSAIDRTNRQLAGETAALFPGFSIVSDAQVNFVRPGFLAPSMDESGIGFHRHEGFGGKLAAWKFAVTEETLAQSHGVPAQFPAHSLSPFPESGNGGRCATQAFDLEAGFFKAGSHCGQLGEAALHGRRTAGTRIQSNATVKEQKAAGFSRMTIALSLQMNGTGGCPEPDLLAPFALECALIIGFGAQFLLMRDGVPGLSGKCSGGARDGLFDAVDVHGVVWYFQDCRDNDTHGSWSFLLVKNG